MYCRLFRANKRLLMMAMVLAVAGGLCGAAHAQQIMIQPNSDLTLKQATEIALKLHPLRMESQSDVLAARAGVGVAQSNMLPQAYGSAEYLRTTDNGIGNTSYFPLNMFPRLTGRNHDQSSANPSQTSQTSDNYMGGVSVSQFLFDFGRVRGFINERRADLDAADAQLKLTDLNLIFAVAQRYYELLAAEQEIKVYDEAIRQRREQRNQATVLAKADLRPGIDVSITQADLSRAEMEQVKAVNARDDAKVALDAAMGMADSAPPYNVVGTLTYSPVTESLPSLLARAYQLRPDLKVLVDEARAAGARVDQFKSDYLPTGSAQLGYTAMGTGLPAANNFFAGLVITWPLFNGFRTEDQIAQARAREHAVGYAFADMRQRVVEEVHTSFLNWQASVVVIKKAEETLTASKQELSLATQRYRQGLSSIIELDDAERRFTADSAAYVTALYGYSVAEAEVQRSTGESIVGIR
ncbi:MAG TPA: TolC family protein [Candidatus Binataceae bacterium]|nr:TolC family protein [Candidatus Binataceae bacterium]